MKRLRQFIKYVGSKHRTAPFYPKPIYQKIEESFAGSASYATLYWWYDVLLNDIDSNMSGLWQWLINAESKDIINIPTVLIEGDNLIDVMGPYESELVMRWQRVGRNNTRTVSSWNGRAGLWNERARADIAAQLVNIKHWNVSNKSYLELENDECTRFVDPPYEGDEFAFYEYNTIDYKELADWCMSRRGQVIVCEQNGAQWLPFKPFREICSTKTNKRSLEVYCEIRNGIIV